MFDGGFPHILQNLMLVVQSFLDNKAHFIECQSHIFHAIDIHSLVYFYCDCAIVVQKLSYSLDVMIYICGFHVSC